MRNLEAPDRFVQRSVHQGKELAGGIFGQNCFLLALGGVGGGGGGVGGEGVNPTMTPYEPSSTLGTLPAKKGLTEPGEGYFGLAERRKLGPC